MTSRLRRCFLLGALLAGFAGACAAQTVRGTVRVESTQAPAAHAIVVFSQGGREKARVITDADGFYYVSRLAPGKYDVKILRKSGVHRRIVQVPPAGATIEFFVGAG